MTIEAPQARLLIVDDEAPQLNALCETLKDHGYSTVGVANGPAALEALQGSKFDLLLSDLMMPGIGGIELLERALKLDPHLVGIIMTGEGTIDTAVDAMKTGAYDYILKPFRLKTLLPVLARALAGRRLRLEKARLEDDLRERTAQLESANKELEAFAYSVSHDLRAPLRAVNGYSQIVLTQFNDKVPPEVARLLNRIHSSGQRMMDLIDALLEFARLGRASITKRPVDMARLATEVAAELQEEAENRRAELEIEDLPNAVGDGLLIRQILHNLLSNAFKFTRRKDRPVIKIGWQASPQGTVYFIQDNGVGFDMAYAQKIFGVFQRLHSEEDFVGNGVGLSNVQRIIQRHGGRIWFDAAEDRGATFYFTLDGTAGGVGE